MTNGYLTEQYRYRTFPALQKVLLDNAASESAKNILTATENSELGRGTGDSALKLLPRKEEKPLVA